MKFISKTRIVGHKGLLGLAIVRQSASGEPGRFKQLIGVVRKIELAKGDGIKKIIEAEASVVKNLSQNFDWKK